MNTHEGPDGAGRPSDLRSDLRDDGESLLGDVKDMVLLVLPVVVGAVVGYVVAGGVGLLVGAGVGVVLVVGYLFWGALALVADAVRWLRGRRSR